MKYITYRRYKDNCLSGAVNIPAQTECSLEGSLILYNNKPICYCTSQHAHQHFTRDDDGQGLLRGQLLCNIEKTLTKQDVNYQTRWDKIWASPLCQKYKRVEHPNNWLWNHEFYIAPIEDLIAIAKLIGIKER